MRYNILEKNTIQHYMEIKSLENLHLIPNNENLNEKI